MPKRISKIAHQYALRELQPGDEFECEPQHVGLLLALGRIEPEEKDTPVDPQQYVTRELVPQGRGRGRPRAA